MHDEKPSSTSMMVALGTLCVAREMSAKDWDPRVASILSSFLRNAPLPFSHLELWSRWKPVRKLLEKTMSFVIPGMFSHYAARKILIEKFVRAEINKGCSQIVVIGGGLDTLTFRIKEDYPEVHCIEIDHPSTHSLKASAVDAANGQLPKVELLSVDLSRRRVSEVLKQTQFEKEHQTVFIIEGVLMYLTEDDVQRTLSDLQPLGRADSSIFLTCMMKADAGRPAFVKSKNGFVTRWLERNHEPFIWGLQKDEVKAFFSSLNFKVEAVSEQSELRQLTSSLPSWFRPPAEGEFFVSLRGMR